MGRIENKKRIQDLEFRIQNIKSKILEYRTRNIEYRSEKAFLLHFLFA
jgi:hypothetical protein